MRMTPRLIMAQQEPDFNVSGAGGVALIEARTNMKAEAHFLFVSMRILQNLRAWSLQWGYRLSNRYFNLEI